MATIGGDTVITVTVKQLIVGVGAAAVVFFGAVWTATTLTLGNLRTDVADIRAAVTDAQDRNANTHQAATTADGDLRAQLTGLTAELKVTNANLGLLSGSVSGLNDSVKSVDDRLATSVVRQESFERWVITRLGTATPVPASFPEGWQKSEGTIVDAIASEGEPLAGWFKVISQP